MNRKELIKEYKGTLQPMGIVQVKNIKNNRVPGRKRQYNGDDQQHPVSA